MRRFVAGSGGRPAAGYRIRRPLRLALAGAVLLHAGAAAAQLPDAAAARRPQLTREAAVTMALAQGSRAALAGATARAALAQLQVARSFGNPVLATSYSKSVPQYHATVDIPLDFLTQRSLRVAAALSAGDAARYRLAFERAAVRVDVDTLYTRASAQAARAALSQRNAQGADSLFTIARVRRDAGDASDLDVELARVNAGQARNVAAADSLSAVATTLDLQAVLGMASDSVAVVLADSLALPPSDLPSALMPDRASAVALPVAAAEQELRAAERAIALERRGRWSGLAVQAGVEAHDPTGSEPGLLPTVGLTLPLPFFNHRAGEVAVATANRDRARAELELTRRATAALIARARRERSAGLARARRDRELVASADRVAQLSLQAYAEGAYALPNVLEAQRNAREALAQLIEDTATAANADAVLRLYTATELP